jgi:hypothetical protein
MVELRRSSHNWQRPKDKSELMPGYWLSMAVPDFYPMYVLATFHAILREMPPLIILGPGRGFLEDCRIGAILSTCI